MSLPELLPARVDAVSDGQPLVLRVLCGRGFSRLPATPELDNMPPVAFRRPPLRQRPKLAHRFPLRCRPAQRWVDGPFVDIEN
jgi:hypothetical protein